MGILKTDIRNAKRGHKLIGVIVPPYVHEFLTLYALAKGTTKSKLYKIMVEEWMMDRRSRETDLMLMKEIVGRLNNQRKIDKANKRNLTFNEFKAAVRLEMEDKGMKESYIIQILDQLMP